MKNELRLAVEPLDGTTNAIIAGSLLVLGILSEGADFSVLPEKGKNNPHPRWECPYNLVSALVVMRKKDKFVRFKIWKRDGPESFSDGEFLFKKKKKKSEKPRI